VLASAKALTTRHDLMIGIREAVQRVLADHPTEVHMVSLSTTLATNAIVEGNGAPICALLLGYGGRVPDDTRFDEILGTSRYALISGGHLTSGEPYQPLDLSAARRAIREHAPHVSAFAVSGYFGTRNPEHEQAIRDLAIEMTGLPVTCGHELTHRLDAIRRATTVALNARLIPLLCDLIAAVERTMEAHEIQAPLMVVKGDGSLMKASMAMERPIETILSGPAASVVGAQHLAQADEPLIVDMGGTTTDIAVIEKGRPRLSRKGARVGQWQTMVEAIDIHTAGIGGDSRVWVDESRDLCIGPRRIVPVSLLATEYPQVVAALERQVARSNDPRATDGQFLLLQQKGWSGNGEGPGFEAKLLEQLRQGPLALDQVYRIMTYPQLYIRYLQRLEQQGIVIRAGLTPTDAAHVLGRYTVWHTEAARLAAQLMARRMGDEPGTLCQRIIHQAAEQIAVEVVDKLLADQGLDGQGAALARSPLVIQALRPEVERTLDLHLTLRRPLLAIGAPVSTYFQRVRELLNSPLIIPEHSEVANAIGAVAGSVVHREHALVTPDADDRGFRVHLSTHTRLFVEQGEALRYASEAALQLATEGALAAGADTVQAQLERHDRTAPVAEGWGDSIYVQTDLTATAVGRPHLATR
jgi:N-methylhydantoinase A/oxoprolinase/acetone carboxylase beta subunit